MTRVQTKRTAVPLHIADLSAFARQMARQMPDAASHQTWLNHMARASGHRNWQHLKAAQGMVEPDPAPDMKQVKRALSLFDSDGRLLRFPGRTGMQMLCLWVLWARLPAGKPMDERVISERLDDMACFRDAAQLRRSMVEGKLLRRTRDGSQYDRIERRPPPEARVLIARLTRG